MFYRKQVQGVDSFILVSILSLTVFKVSPFFSKIINIDFNLNELKFRKISNIGWIFKKYTKHNLGQQFMCLAPKK